MTDWLYFIWSMEFGTFQNSKSSDEPILEAVGLPQSVNPWSWFRNERKDFWFWRFFTIICRKYLFSQFLWYSSFSRFEILKTTFWYFKILPLFWNARFCFKVRKLTFRKNQKKNYTFYWKISHAGETEQSEDLNFKT